jgi:predicted ATPase/DNA-binding CsgD family transcriptional regulator
MARSSRRVGNLPAESSSFIGRRQELAELRRKLGAARLVTLVGPGGVGKTRLALRIAADLARGFRDGAWFVELADIEEAALVDDVVIAALDLRAQAAIDPRHVLRSHLRDRELLLVLDNCEHLVGAAARIVTDVLRAGPGVRVIATSREALSVPGEHVIPVAPLELPPVGAADEHLDVSTNEAVALFVERAAAASGDFVLTGANQVVVAEICRRLDGLPLAIELAAVRTRTLGVEQILPRLADRFGLLTGGARAALPRQQTLRTTIDWSHDLLGTRERELLRRLGVFGGRFTLDDVESVCASSDTSSLEVVDLLSSLVEKSLVIREDAGGRASYRLHETMRAYARLKLREAGEEAIVERRCVEHVRSACLRSAVEALYRLPEWLAWIELEIDSIRAVLQRCIAEDDVESGLDIAGSLGWYWSIRATVEGVRWLDTLLAMAPDDSATHGWAAFARGFLAVAQGDPIAARSALLRAEVSARGTGQLPLLSLSLSAASIVETVAGDHAAAKDRLDESAAIAADLDEPSAQLGLLHAQALDGLFRGDLDAARSASTAGERLSREVGALYVLELHLQNLGFVALVSRDLDEAQRYFAEGLRIARQIDDRVGQSYLLAALGCRLAGAGQPARAARLFGAAETVLAGAGAMTMSGIAAIIAQAEASAIDAIGALRHEAEVAAGRRMTRGAAIGLALGEGPAVTRTASGDTAPGPLGKRGSEVARLVADGLTNKEIGARLFISERTVDGHVRNILDRLGFDSRTQIAAWVASSEERSRPD